MEGPRTSHQNIQSDGRHWNLRTPECETRTLTNTTSRRSAGWAQNEPTREVQFWSLRFLTSLTGTRRNVRCSDGSWRGRLECNYADMSESLHFKFLKITFVDTLIFHRSITFDACLSYRCDTHLPRMPIIFLLLLTLVYNSLISATLTFHIWLSYASTYLPHAYMLLT
jgi:hypothetical protein